jgi:hypothetical protein
MLLSTTACDIGYSLALPQVRLYWRLVTVLQPQQQVSCARSKKVAHWVNCRF